MSIYLLLFVLRNFPQNSIAYIYTQKFVFYGCKLVRQGVEGG